MNTHIKKQKDTKTQYHKDRNFPCIQLKPKKFQQNTTRFSWKNYSKIQTEECQEQLK